MATASAQDTTCPPGYDYRAITDALVELHRDRAFQRGEQAAAYCRTLDEQIVQGANITTARERATAASVDLDVQALRVEGEIAACQAKLRYLDHLTNGSA